MSEYWKSVPRKFCDFCKCWITDNKPSVDFHERGKRHQENVELRLREVRKKSLQDADDQKKLESDMARMEKAALEAFKNDLKDNPELAKQYGVSLEPKPSQSENPDSTDTAAASSGGKSKKRKKSAKKKEWYEAASPDGYSYFWNTKTGETTWTAPDEYVSVAEQAEAEKSEQKGADTNNTARQADSSTVTDSRTGFGSWEVVSEEKQAVLYDETSAPPELGEIPLPSLGEPEGGGGGVSQATAQKPKFKEKTVTSLGSAKSRPVAFKKRKVATGARNVRQRDNDD